MYTFHISYSSFSDIVLIQYHFQRWKQKNWSQISSQRLTLILYQISDSFLCWYEENWAKWNMNIVSLQVIGGETFPLSQQLWDLLLDRFSQLHYLQCTIFTSLFVAGETTHPWPARWDICHTQITPEKSSCYHPSPWRPQAAWQDCLCCKAGQRHVWPQINLTVTIRSYVTSVGVTNTFFRQYD